jgi:hypothetical protein
MASVGSNDITLGECLIKLQRGEAFYARRRKMKDRGSTAGRFQSDGIAIEAGGGAINLEHGRQNVRD